MTDPEKPDADETRLRRPAHEDTTKKRIQTVRSQASALHLQPGRRFTLTVTAGPDAGRVFTIERPRVVIGRKNPEIELSDSEASRNHAALEFDGEIVTLVDLESTNGTFVSGERVQSVRIGNYGEFQIGNTTLMLTITDVFSPA